ncbi:hypothetical protein P7K49_024311 [Saguinus oedipus]|uniref:Homeobox domain-containing protein n=1 Tax=Saguinus oedipus TaxID=9490 RepID=A0ABQ9UPX5_SAGOE|nr:hypothetical protein P7K49_024311 [Saguinus oedipus]
MLALTGLFRPVIDVPESTASEQLEQGRKRAAVASAPLLAAPGAERSERRCPGPPHLGPHHLHPGHAEPISFGIDQILNSPDQGGCMGPASRLQDGEYGLGCLVGGAYTYGGGGSAAGAGAGGAGAYGTGGGGGACSMGPLAGSYNVNMALAGGSGPGGGGGGSSSGAGALSAAGVIRVPAHRPLAGAVAHPQPLATGLPTVPSVPAVPGDRFTGESGPRSPRLAVARAPCYPFPAGWLPKAGSARQLAFDCPWRRGRKEGGIRGSGEAASDWRAGGGRFPPWDPSPARWGSAAALADSRGVGPGTLPDALPLASAVCLSPAPVALSPFTVTRRIGHPYQNRTPPKKKKPRTSFTRLQICELEKRFHRQKYLASAERAALAKALKMTDAQPRGLRQLSVRFRSRFPILLEEWVSSAARANGPVKRPAPCCSAPTALPAECPGPQTAALLTASSLDARPLRSRSLPCKEKINPRRLRRAASLSACTDAFSGSILWHPAPSRIFGSRPPPRSFSPSSGPSAAPRRAGLGAGGRNWTGSVLLASNGLFLQANRILLQLQQEAFQKSLAQPLPADPLCVHNSSLFALQNLQPWSDDSTKITSVTSVASACE